MIAIYRLQVAIVAILHAYVRCFWGDIDTSRASNSVIDNEHHEPR